MLKTLHLCEDSVDNEQKKKSVKIKLKLNRRSLASSATYHKTETVLQVDLFDSSKSVKETLHVSLPCTTW